MDYKFQNKGKFALLTFENAYADLSTDPFQLSDGPWVMPSVPVPDLRIWKKWLGSIRMEQLEAANLVLLLEEQSGNPEILDDVHQRLGSATEHLHPLDQQEDVCRQRTRQLEHLACDVFSRVLRDPEIQARFRTEAKIAAFWKLPDEKRRTLWGEPLDIEREPLVQKHE